MSKLAWLDASGRLHAALEVALLSFALILPLSAILGPALGAAVPQPGASASEGALPVLGIGLAYVGYFAALFGALRVPRAADDGPWSRLAREVVSAVVVIFAVWIGALLAHVAGALVAANSLRGGQEGVPFALPLPLLALASASSAAVAYPLCRGGVLAWSAWQRLRRRRLLWALAHAQLVASLILALGVAVYSAVVAPGDSSRFGPPFGPEMLPQGASPAARGLAWVTTRLLPGLTELLALGLGAAALLVPPSALISYLVLRQTTSRLEELAGATGALRSGELEARVPISGEDEVSRLQADFNSMAADLERTLRDLRAERDRVAGLLEARRQLVASVSHELRTPVSTVSGYLDSALEGDRATRTDLETMRREMARLERLIDDLFALSRAQVRRLELRLEPTDVGAIVSRLVATVAPLAWERRRVEVLAQAPEDLPLARADAGRLEQVIGNLVANAVRHTPPGGLVAVVVSGQPDAVRVEVRDTGEGIAPEELPVVFERYYRGSSGRGSSERDASEGAGLGLALVKDLTEAMGGSVEVASVPGEGSCFTVRLPRA